jgi:ORF6N domain
MTTLFDTAGIRARIFILPNRPPFMIAVDLAEVYGTSVSALNQAVSRNPERFPDDFMFTFSEVEMEDLKSQNVISTKANRALPVGFTHAGAYALSAVLKTPTAAQVSVIVHRAFAAMEKAALDEAKFLLLKLQNEETSRKRVRMQVRAGMAAGLTFDGIRRMGNYSGPALALAVRECLHLGLIDRLPQGMPMEQPDLFAGV